jgi:hypothetical protein
MATVVREIERKYDLAAGSTAALDAVRTMTGKTGVAAASRQDEQFLDAVYYDTADLRLIGAGQGTAATARRSPRQRRRADSAARARRKGPGGRGGHLTYGLMHQRQACQAATMEQALPRFTARGFVDHRG